MDGLSTAVNVISLATALKDIIKLAQDIHEAFKNGPQNLKEAKSLAMDIEKTAQKMQNLFSQDQDRVPYSHELEEALRELCKEMKVVQDRCHRLVPPLSQNKRDRFLVAVYSVKNRKKVANMLSVLKENINKNYQEFMVFSIARTEGISHRIEVAVNRLVTYNTPFSAPSQFQSDQETSHTSLFLPWISEQYGLHGPSPVPSAVTVSTMFGNEFTASLQKELIKSRNQLSLLESRLSDILPSVQNLNPFKFEWDFQVEVIPVSPRQQNTMISIYHFQSLLSSSNPGLVDIKRMSRGICDELCRLGLVQESKLLQESAMKIWKRMTIENPSSSVMTYYSEALTSFAMDHFNLTDYHGSYAESATATAEIHRLSQVTRSIDLQVLMAMNLSMQADALSSLGQREEGSNLARRALDTIYQALGFDIFPLPFLTAEDFRQPKPHFSVLGTRTVAQNITSSHLFGFAIILQDVSWCHLSNHLYDEALAARKHCLLILGYLLEQYPQSKLLLDDIRSSLAFLVSHGTLNLTMEERLLFAENFVAICQWMLKDSDAAEDFIYLFTALGVHRDILASRGYHQETEAVYSQIVELSERGSTQYFDLTLPSDLQANFYLNLAFLHQLHGRSIEAIQAARHAIGQCSALNALHLHQDHSRYIEAMTFLLNISNDRRHLYDALADSYNALNHISTVHEQYQELIDSILEALDNLARLSVGFFDTPTDTKSRFQTLFNAKSSKSDIFLLQYLRGLYGRACNHAAHGASEKAVEYATQALSVVDRFFHNFSDNNRLCDMRQTIKRLHEDICLRCSSDTIPEE